MAEKAVPLASPMTVPAENERSLLLVGAGDWGKNLARCFEQLGALRAIVVPSEQEAAALGSAFPNARLGLSLREALTDPAIDKVAIATPAATHFELAQLALEAGKDVLVEKPLCLQLAQAEALLQQASARGRTLMVGHLLQYHPCVVRLRELVASGALGKLFTINSTRLNLGKFRTDENALYSFAPHDVSLVLSLVGDRMPRSVRCSGASHLKPGVADSTLTVLRFDDDVLVQMQVSWLNPFKEQKLTIVGSAGMAVFDDTKPWAEKLLVYRDYLSLAPGRAPQPRAAEGEAQLVPEAEPLREECAHFLASCKARSTPRTDGHEGLRVLRVLDMAQRSLERDGELVHGARPYFAHESAVVDEGAQLGQGCKIWHFSHVMAGAKLGERCNVGQNVFIADGVEVGSDVKIQNNVSLYTGVHVESHVFIGPSCVFTNVKNPRAELNRRHAYQRTYVRHGASVGAGAVIVCGVTLGRHCFVGAGAVVTRDVPDYALVVGNPARQLGWMSRHGHRLEASADGTMVCPESGLRYRELTPGHLVCVDEPASDPA